MRYPASRRLAPCVSGLVVLVFGLVAVSPERSAHGQPLVRVEPISLGTDGNMARHHSGSWQGTTHARSRISADGRHVVFESNAGDVICNDNDSSLFDIFVRDRLTGRAVLASPARDGSEANDHSSDPVISAGGRHVVFHSQATNLVPGDTNGFGDVFLHDLQAGTTTLVSVSSTGEPADSISYGGAISADGRYVAFHSLAANLVPGDTNGYWDVFVRDMVAGTIERVSVTTAGEEGHWGGTNSTISADGRYVAFLSQSLLEPAVFNQTQEVFIRDRQAGTTRLASFTASGGISITGIRFAELSADGRFLAFQSNADNVVTPDANGFSHDVFLRDLAAGTTTLLSVATDGTQGNHDSWSPSISAGGRYVAFHSWANNLVPGDTNIDPYFDVFVRDTLLGTTTRVSVAADGGEAEPSSHTASISADGTLVCFDSTASNLAPGDRNGFQDVFLAGPAFPGSAPAPSFQLVVPSEGVPEGGGPATITVVRTGPLCTTATVRYATADGTATAGAGAGADYAATSGLLTFLPGAASSTFEIAILADALDEPDETIHLTLASPTGGPVLGEGSTATLAILDDNVPRVSIRSVSPARVPFPGGVEVVFEGTAFLEAMVPRLGGLALLGKTFLDPEHLSGFAPELPLGQLVDAELVDAEGNVLAVLANAVEVVAPDLVPVSRLLGPQQVEGSLAEGTARFTWSNPFAAQQILVKDQAGGLLRTLSGSIAALEMPAGNQDEARVYLESVFADGSRSELVEAIAARSICEWPPPLTGADQESDQELTIYGGGTPDEVFRCGLGRNLIVDLEGLGLKQVRSLEPSIFRPAGAGAGGGGALFSPQAGTLITNQTAESFRRLEQIYPGVSELYTRRLITGFTLEQDADKLQIEARYSMPVYEFGVELRGRLVHVHPDDGFADELTFPEIKVGSGKEWHGITYFRAAEDVIDPNARPCGQKIPAGDYRLELHAVAGDPESPHFVFETDGRNQEILIRGVPCPPYPRVRVLDLTGRRTLPVITGILGQALAVQGQTQVELTAFGYWTDEDGGVHSIRPGDASFIPHDFTFHWTVNCKSPSVTVQTPRKSSLQLPVPRVGCYRVELSVEDPACRRRSSPYVQEVPVKPSFVCAIPPPYYSFFNPTPDPSTIHAVAGLGTVRHMGSLPGRIEPITVFVVPAGCCDGSDDCETPQVSDLRFRLRAGAQEIEIPERYILDLCQESQRGPKYFQVLLDLDQVPLLVGAEGGKVVDVQLEAKPAPTTASGETWQPVGGPLRMTNRPECLTASFWEGAYEKATGTYRFVVESARDGAHRFDQIASTRPKNIFEDIADAALPSFPSAVNAGIDYAFKTVNGRPWQADQSLSSLSGKVLGNQLDTSPITTPGRELLDQIPGALPVWEWSERKEILEKQVQQKFFESILFTGVIVVIPVTIWGSISLALDVKMEAFASGKISPFAPLRGDSHYFTSDLGVETEMEVSLPAELRADILFGIVSHSLSLETSAESTFSVGLRTFDTEMFPTLALMSHLDVSLGLKICMLWFYCLPKLEVPLLDHCLIDYRFPPVAGHTPCDEGSGGGDGVNDVTIHELLSGAATAVSPDRDTVLDFYFSGRTDRLVGEASTWDGAQVLRGEIAFGVGFPTVGPLDMAAAFMGDDQAIVLLTTSFPEESAIPFPLAPGHTPTREELNELKAQDDILMGLLVRGPQRWEAHTPRRLCDPTEAVLPANRRADGRPALAGSVRHGDAIAAWVRMEDREYLIEEPTTTIVYDAVGDGEALVHVPREEPTVRPRLETAAIYTRRIGFAGLLGPPRRISTGGINVEPTIAFSPTGDEAWCVWVNDSEHTDLIGSNRGRNLLCSVWQRATDSWSAPWPVLVDTDLTPGVLEPSLTLKANGTGLLAFNALERGAPEIDTGLAGAGRFVYTSRLEGGVFGPPVLVHGLCGKRVVGRYQTLSFPYEVAPFDPRQGIFKNPPDWVMTLQGAGPLGSPESSGGVMVSVIGKGMETFTPPVSLTLDGRTHTNVLGTVFNGGLHSINLKGGLARVGGGAGAGGGQPLDTGYEILDHALDPDLALVSCKLSDQFPGAGTFIEGRISVENRGLAGSAMDANGRSLCGVRLIYTRIDGTETVEGEELLPVLEPGGTHVLTFQLEMPLDPVRLRAEVFPNPGDGDPANDVAACFFGAPQPLDFACQVFRVRRAGEQDLSVSLSWTNPIGYDELHVYRDSSMLASLPGASTSFVEHGVTPGQHIYELRGQVGASRSARQRLLCPVVEPQPPETFRRGDTDVSGALDISDAVSLLGFLFLGGAEPACQDAADADDNGALEITDAIRILGFLFLGAAAPPAPGTSSCGIDPTVDGLPGCGARCPAR